MVGEFTEKQVTGNGLLNSMTLAKLAGREHIPNSLADVCGTCVKETKDVHRSPGGPDLAGGTANESS